jgi:type III restriction enzyme
MKLKDYQNGVLEALSRYLGLLAAKRDEAEEFVAFQKSKGRDAKPADYCRDTWEALAEDAALPRAKNTAGELVTPAYLGRLDGLKRPVPNVCLKIPTGGGKTLLGCAAVEKLNVEYFKRQTGFVLWVVPSDAIYSQTWKAFANREHPYRQMLERASGGRVKLLERRDAFTRQDVDQYLCVMLLMLQASARKTKEQLKMFQDSGQFTSFFPDVDDSAGNRKVADEIPNLDVNDMADAGFRSHGTSLKQSLGNVLRLVRPVIIIDEGHKAYSPIALDTLAGFNPRFILEMSATPNAKEHASNILVNVTGTALQTEQMIKLPINLINEGRADWKHALNVAKEKLDALQKDALKVRNNEDRYIRPILLIRVERTGKDQRDKAAVHSEDVREYLTEKLGAQPEQIKVKSAEMDELDKVDLPSELCPVRYIITKDALREGWDCPFAYVLAILSKTTAATALTQMVGRVLRQPGARVTTVQSLNECYVFTFDQEVQAAVDAVRQGLQEEGMGDIASAVRAAVPGGSLGSRKATVARRKAFAGLRIFMPRVLSRHYATRAWRPFDYDRDLLSRLDWSAFSFKPDGKFAADHAESIERTLVRVRAEDLNDPDDKFTAIRADEAGLDTQLDEAALVRLLLDAIPNPWQGTRILHETLALLRGQGISERRLFTNRFALVKAMRDDLREQVHKAGEAEFRRMLAADEICFRLESSADPKLNWELAQTFDLEVTDADKELLGKSGAPLERSLFERVYQKQVNGLEKDVAWYLDADKAVHWWHRVAVHNDWHLQGWQRNRVYPDFLACLHDKGDGVVRFTVLETKGLHLAGNEDTAYKERLFALLTAHSLSAVPVGELKLAHKKQQLRFELLLEKNWQARMPAALGA